jgi:uroporphyrin-III C-methyltransferase/precorrin-2 dehydrogenase/sirohydrochlorin ferrochelatase
MPGQRLLSATLSTVADRMAAQAIRPPAIVVVGPVVEVAASLSAVER